MFTDFFHCLIHFTIDTQRKRERDVMMLCTIIKGNVYDTILSSFPVCMNWCWKNIYVAFLYIFQVKLVFFLCVCVYVAVYLDFLMIYIRNY